MAGRPPNCPCPWRRDVSTGGHRPTLLVQEAVSCQDPVSPSRRCCGRSFGAPAVLFPIASFVGSGGCWSGLSLVPFHPCHLSERPFQSFFHESSECCAEILECRLLLRLPPEGLLALGEGPKHLVNVFWDEQQVLLFGSVDCTCTVLDQEVVIVLSFEMALLDPGKSIEFPHQILHDIVMFIQLGPGCSH
jgi:hypothetical protein